MNDTKMTGMELRATWSLCTVLSLRMLGMFMVLPVLTTYGMTLQGASEFLIGLSIGIYGLMQAICQIPCGLFADRVGRKQFIIGGLLVFSLGSFIAAMTENIWGVILGRALQGSGTVSAAIMALLSDLTREQNRTKAMAFIGVSFGVTFAIAMVVSPIITHNIGLRGLFGGITALALVSVFLTQFVVPNAIKHTINREANIVRSSIGKILTNSQLLKLNMSIFCLHTILMSNFIALPAMMAAADFLPNKQWKVYLITMLVSFAAVVPAIIYAEVKRRMKLLLLGCVTLLLFTELLLIFANGYLLMMFVGIQLFFLAFYVIEALLPSLISKEAPASYKGTAMGVYSTSQFIGVAFGGTLGGFMLQTQGSCLVFLAGAVVALAWWVISATLREPPYVSSLRITLPISCASVDYDQLAQRLQAHPGVTEVVVVPQEHSVYVKVDITQTNRTELEKAVAV
ncbi:MFS transporter [Sodalis endosymbiont of Henestaris halophilus]|uniref:MFS transporter n=1 Tax=Sodalis endosymbiont of Henestaris halophilus TaxID=1929246 RepID=UPI000BC048BF|nr:MFS transporter [Sodalis endosymbiont of Henestaris halophilus]SNC58505.1 Inner membrane transport protein YajR [Sodalis endosymbiont of Henestaris halophilus]